MKIVYETEVQKQRDRCTKNYIEDKLLVFNHYSNNNIKCECCGERRIEFLSIDHINGGGNEHRRELKITSGRRFYRWLIKNNYPDGYRILCNNCNMALGSFGYCPHHPEIKLNKIINIIIDNIIKEKCLIQVSIKI